MYTVSVGKRLIACINQRDGTKRTPREFFDDVYFPLFFGSERFLQNVNNSPVDQAYKMRAKNPLTAARLAASLADIHQKATTNDVPDGSFYLGGPAKGTTETTSGQVTSMVWAVQPDDIYASWIGAALGVGINGGLSMLIEDDDVLLALYDGWKSYRRLLDQTPTLKPMQINTWNGQWLTWRFGRDWDAFGLMPQRMEGDTSTGHALKTQTWVQLLFALAYHYRGQELRTLTAYVYSLGQTNRTVGFIRLNLPEVRRPYDLYQQLFTAPEGLPSGAFEQLYETELSYFVACEQGSIGLRALQPKGLRKYMPERRTTMPAKIVISHSAPEQLLSVQIYETWIIAMLNNKDLSERTMAIAKALHTYAQEEERARTTRIQLVERVLEAQNRRAFIEALTVILDKSGGLAELFDQAVSDILSLPESNVPLFLTLLRFKHAYVAARG